MNQRFEFTPATDFKTDVDEEMDTDLKAPSGLTMDAQGRMLDGKGNIIHMK